MRNIMATCLLALTVLASASISSASSVTTYRDRVHKSFLALDSLRARVINDDALVTTSDDLMLHTFDEVRSLLPPTETVDSEGSRMQVDNQWLYETLEKLTGPSFSIDDRKRMLTETTERLAALDNGLTELEKLDSTNANTASKDEARVRLSNILRRDEYAKQAAEGNALARLWQRFWTWLRSLFPNAPEIEPGRAKFLSQLAQILIVAMALAVIGYVAWKFGPRVWRRSAKRKKGGKREARIVLGEILEADQSSADLLAEAEALARDGNLRAAIRKGYIALLCELGDRKVLGLAGHKTNRDYLRSVRSHEQLFREMQVLTNSFENHWYGFVPADMNDWNMFRARYQQALAK